ncbi:MAG TPA: hypothetical protein PKZ68_01900 [Pseudomonadales bacterium]|nr:hypothetical protein [Pseudomonadales bacterium]HNN86834.1 hypothetical protein [Pseudomonadales bacterium]
MRTQMSLVLAVLVVVGCSSYEDDYRQTNGRYYPNNSAYYGSVGGNTGGGGYVSGGYYSGGGGYSPGGYDGGGTTVYETNNYNTYYPFGNVYYPRDRIWIIGGYYGGCNYYSYRGYCYRYRDDFDRVIIWDRQHGYDDNWYSRRQDWCRRHDCHHDDMVRDGKGRPIEPQRIERDRMQSVTPQSPAPRTPYPVYKTNRDDRADDNRGSGRPAWGDRQPVVRYSPQPVVRDAQPQSEPNQPVIQQHSRPVFMPRNNNSGWGGSAAGSDSDSSSRYGQAPPRGNEGGGRSMPPMQTRDSNRSSMPPVQMGSGRSQENSGNSSGGGRQRQWNAHSRGTSSDEQ